MYIVEFPGLWGLKFSINPVAFNLGSISIYWYGIIIAVSFMVAVFLGMKGCKNYGITEENVIDLVLFTAPAAIIFARLYYVAFSWDKYKDNLAEIFKTWHGGLAIYGGVLGALLVGYIFARVKKIKPLRLFDFGMPYVVLAQAIGRWGNFVNQEAYGSNTTLPWGMTSEKIRNELASLQAQGMNVSAALPVHPTFLYESLWNLGVFFFLMWYRKKKKLEGEIFFLYMILYGVGRFWIEGLRTDSLMLGSFKISQVLAGAFVVTLSVIFYLRRRKLAAAIDGNIEIGTSEYGSILRNIKEEESKNANIENAEAETDVQEADEKDTSE